MESALDRVLRLAAVQVKPYRRVQNGRVQAVRQSTQQRKPGQGGGRFGTPYRLAWSKVNVGDVLEFGKDLWKVIPAAQFPGFKPPVSSGTTTSAGTGAATGGSTTGVSTGASTSSGTGAATGGSAGGVGGVQVFTNYLQNLTTGQYDQLSLPSDFVVTVVPMLP